MADVIAKRLSFSRSLDTTLDGSDVRLTVAKLTSALEELNDVVTKKGAAVHETAAQQLRITGGRQCQKRQIQSLKSSLLNLGQKESFVEAIKSFPEGHDFKPESDRAAAAVESAEEDLKDLKKINQQDEEQLRQAVQTLAGFYDQYQSVVARVQQKLALTCKELEMHEASRPPPMSPQTSGPGEAECEALLAAEAARATELEASLAQAQAGCSDMEALIKAEENDIMMMQAEITQLQALKDDRAARQASQEERFQSSLMWCDEMMEILARTTGVSLLSIEEDAVHLQLQQDLPLALDVAQGVEMRTVEHKLSIHLQPNSSRVQSAQLQPPVVDVRPDVDFALMMGGSAMHLVAAVRERLRTYWRRQTLIEEASKRYAMAPSSPNQPTVSVTLPSTNVQAEVDVPVGWPDNEQPLQLRFMRWPASPGVSEPDLTAVMARWQQQDGNKARDLVQLLDAACSFVHTYGAKC